MEANNKNKAKSFLARLPHQQDESIRYFHEPENIEILMGLINEAGNDPVTLIEFVQNHPQLARCLVNFAYIEIRKGELEVQILEDDADLEG